MHKAPLTSQTRKTLYTCLFTLPEKTVWFAQLLALQFLRNPVVCRIRQTKKCPHKKITSSKSLVWLILTKFGDFPRLIIQKSVFLRLNHMATNALYFPLKRNACFFKNLRTNMFAQVFKIACGCLTRINHEIAVHFTHLGAA